MKERYFFYSFIAIVTGIITAALLSFSVLGAIVVAVLSFLFFKRKFLMLFVLLMSLSMAITALSYREYTVKYKNITLTGTVLEVRESNDNVVLIIRDCEYKEIKDTKVYVYIYDYKYDTEIRQGNIIELYGDAHPIKYGHINPGEQPYSSLNSDIGYSFYAEKYTVLNDCTDMEYRFQVLRDNMRKTIFSSVDHGGSAAVLYAMITGDKNYIQQEIIDIFAYCGTSHLLAVSGLHIGILLNLFVYFLEKLRIRNIISLILLGAFATVYSAFTGFSSSVLRALIMALAAALSRMWGGKYDSVNSLGFAGSCILIFEPFRLFDAAFQLSFAACFGIAWITKHSFGTRIKIVDGILNTGLITVGATVFTLPLQLYYFGIVSVVSVLANIMLVSVASFALMLAFLLIIPAMLWQSFCIGLKAPGYIMEAVIEISRKLAEAPSFVFKPTGIVLTVAAIALMVFFTRFVHVRSRIKHIVSGLLLLICIFSSVFTLVFKENNASVSVPVFDEDTLCVHIDDGKYYVVGLCSEKDSLSRQVQYISRNTDKVEGVFILTEAHMSALKEAMDMGLTFNALYVAPELTLNKTARMNKAQYLEKTIFSEKGYFKYDGGLVFSCGERSVFIDGNLEPAYKKYDIAVSLRPQVRAQTLITKGDTADKAQKVYDIEERGHTRLFIRSN